MICNRKDFDRDINGLLSFAADKMPEGWEVRICVVNDEVSMTLYDDEGAACDVYMDGEDHVGHWLLHINHAREAEGMDPVTWDEAND